MSTPKMVSPVGIMVPGGLTLGSVRNFKLYYIMLY